MIGLIITLIVIGLLLYVAEQIPMDGTVRQILRYVVIVCLVVWLLGIFGLLPADMPVPRMAR